MVDFGKCLIDAQDARNVTSAELARRLKVHRQQINIWRNKTNVRLDTALKVCEALEIELDEFLFSE